MAEKHSETYVRYWKGMEKFKQTIKASPERDFKTGVTVLVGEPGTGKSRLAYEISKQYRSCYYKSRRQWCPQFYIPNIVVKFQDTTYFENIMRILGHKILLSSSKSLAKLCCENQFITDKLNRESGSQGQNADIFP